MFTKTADTFTNHPIHKEWFVSTPPVGEWARRFYREYAGIKNDEELKEHLIEIRSLAWEVEKYRCIASFYFVNYCLMETYGKDWYAGIVERIRGGDLMLDLGCAFGHTARNLVYDGAPYENIISGDLRQEFWDLGFKLFRDKESFHGQFRQGDIFDEKYLEDFNGKIDIIHISAVFHLFDIPIQKTLARRLCQMVSSKPGTTIFGRNAGGSVPELLTHSSRPGAGIYIHSEASFRELIEECVSGSWDVKTWSVPRKENAVAENGKVKGVMCFILTRL